MKLPGAWSHGLALLLLAAVLAGAVAWWGANRYLTLQAAELRSEYQARYAPIGVVVARETIEAGAALTARALARREMPRGYIPPGAITPSEMPAVLGRRTRIALQRGDTLTQAAVMSVGSVRLADEIPAGRRALTLPVDEVISHNGLLRPGDRVDLLMAKEARDGLAEPSGEPAQVVLVLANVRVLATDRAFTAIAPGASDSAAHGSESVATLTLDVTPLEAALLAREARGGELIALLRATGDTAPLHAGIVAGRRPPLAPGARVELWIGGSADVTPARRWISVAPGLTRTQATVQR
jgi:pilus assembly protein CpaB